MTTRLLTIQPLNAATFEPFGQVLASPAAALGQDIGTGTYWPDCLPLADGVMAAGLITYHQRDLHIWKMERHSGSGQSFIHVGGGAALLVAAAGVDPSRPDDTPDLASLTGFVINPDQGVRLERNTWHVSPFPLHGPVTFVMLAAPRTIEDGTEWRELPERIQVAVTLTGGV